MKPDVSLPRLQEPATCPYPQPARSSPCPQPTFWTSILILSFHLRLGLPSCFFPASFPATIPYTLSPSRTWYMPRPSYPSRLLASRFKPRNGRPGCTFLFASSPLMCPAWEVLPVTQLPWHGPQGHLTTQAQPLQDRVTFVEHNVIRSPTGC